MLAGSRLDVSLRALAAVTLALQLVRPLAEGHPQCLDSAPPFRSATSLSFCGSYASFGCCTADDAQRVAETYQRAVERVPFGGGGGCRRMLAEVACLQCSPYAAHLYGLEGRGSVALFPGLCRSYCGELYRRCSLGVGDLLALIVANDSALLGAAELGEDYFCNAVAIPDMDYCYPDLTRNDFLMRRAGSKALSAGARATGVRNDDDSSEGCLCVQRVARRLRSPVFIVNANDGSNRLFVGEQLGVVRVMHTDAAASGAVAGNGRLFLNISSRVLVSSAEGDERGLLGMAFHPAYAQNGRFFVYYYAASTSEPSAASAAWAPRSPGVIRISEMRVSKRNRNRANDKSETVLLEIAQPRWNHNGGQLLFGEDGHLYVFTGDGGGAGDPDDYAQDLSVLLGKVLRIDVNQGAKSYAVPPDNPFVNVTFARPEIFAYGLRNPWRCSVDRGSRQSGAGRGRIFCGDVGQHTYEEIDIIVPGGNYGWNVREGPRCYGELDWCDWRLGSAEQLPIHFYNHTLGKSVTGGYVYRGCSSPGLEGAYIFGDYVSGRLFTLTERPSGDNASRSAATTEWTAMERRMCGPDMCFGSLSSEYPAGITSFGEDENGEVYMACTDGGGAAAYSGEIYRIIDPFERNDPTTCKLPGTAHRLVEAHSSSVSAKPTDESNYNGASGAASPVALGDSDVGSDGEDGKRDGHSDSSLGGESDVKGAERLRPAIGEEMVKSTNGNQVVDDSRRSSSQAEQETALSGDRQIIGAQVPKSDASTASGQRDSAMPRDMEVKPEVDDSTQTPEASGEGSASTAGSDAGAGDEGDVSIIHLASDVVSVCFRRPTEHCYMLLYDGNRWHLAI